MDRAQSKEYNAGYQAGLEDFQTVNPSISTPRADWSEKTREIVAKLEPEMKFKIRDGLRDKKTMRVIEINLPAPFVFSYEESDWRGDYDGSFCSATETNLSAYGDDIEIIEV
jgi:hypothetical protein